MMPQNAKPASAENGDRLVPSSDVVEGKISTLFRAMSGRFATR
jgi:hypothetical protein